MRKNIVAGNWKMNKNVIEAQQLMFQLLQYKKNNATNCEVWIAPPSIYLMMAKDIYEHDEIGVFAQDMSEHESGAYTGEISAEMLKSIDVTGSIIGHSERRQYHGETDSHCNRKVKLALDKGLTPIYCNGETLEQRKAGQHLEVVKEGYSSEISKFKPETPEGMELTDEILKSPNAILIFSYKPNEADKDLIAETESKAKSQKNALVLGISTQPNTFKTIDNATMDATAIKTIARSNPFVLTLQNGKIVDKMSAKDYLKK